MKGRLTTKGTFQLDKGRGFINQFCPYQSNPSRSTRYENQDCDVYCPFFTYGEKSFEGIIFVELCRKEYRFLRTQFRNDYLNKKGENKEPT